MIPALGRSRKVTMPILQEAPGSNPGQARFSFLAFFWGWVSLMGVTYG